MNQVTEKQIQDNIEIKTLIKTIGDDDADIHFEDETIEKLFAVLKIANVTVSEYKKISIEESENIFTFESRKYLVLTEDERTDIIQDYCYDYILENLHDNLILSYVDIEKYSKDFARHGDYVGMVFRANREHIVTQGSLVTIGFETFYIYELK